MNRKPRANIVVRQTRPDDFEGIIALGRLIYPEAVPWTRDQLASHLKVFPEGQVVAIDEADNAVVGMTASLIVRWDDYNFNAPWRGFTSGGYFTNHDPDHGRTLYGADVMVHPHRQRRGIGHKLYEARRDTTRRLKLLRIRAGARLRNYHRYADKMSAKEYVQRVVAGDLQDATLSFQLREGFRVIGVVSGYIMNDPESLGHAAIIEWLNRDVASREDFAARPTAFTPAGARRELRDSGAPEQ